VAVSELSSLSVFVAVDRSEAMAPFAMSTHAMLADLISDPFMSGMALALRPFPDEPANGNCNTQTCNFDECRVPLVDYGELLEASAPEDRHEAALQAALGQVSPGEDDAPVAAAFAGALAAATARNLEDPRNRSSVLLVTAGATSGCGEEIPEMIALARDALEAQGIRTFVAVPAPLMSSDLEQVAEAGGTFATFPIEGNADDLVASLQPIRGALTCDFALPEPSVETPIDFDLTQFSASVDDGPPMLFPNVRNEAACDETLGWYFDDELEPTRVLMCPALCYHVTSARSARVEISCYCRVDPPMPD
jgi:hypothetical protein